MITKRRPLPSTSAMVKQETGVLEFAHGLASQESSLASSARSHTGRERWTRTGRRCAIIAIMEREAGAAADGRPRRIERLFIVRIWYESGSARGAAWRGSVENTATGARRYFADYATLTAFIATETGPE